MSKQNPSWIEAHEQLKISMQKEISIMREILANMHQEELSLLLNDRGSWTQVLQDRFPMIERLSDLRKQRMDATQKIEAIAKLDSITTPTLEQILPTEDESSCEILSLRDQLMALVEKINFQNNRNTTLFQQVEHQFDVPYHSSHRPIPNMSSQRARKKASVATYNFKR